MGDCKVYVIVREDPGYPNADHYDCLNHLRKDSCISLVSPEQAEAIDFDHLLIGWSHAHPYSSKDYRLVCRLANRANTVGALAHKVHRTFWRNLAKGIKELFDCFPVPFKFRSIGYEDSYLPLDIYSLWAKKYMIGGGPHPHILFDEDALKQLFTPWDVAGERKYRLNYMGSSHPRSRGDILEGIRAHLEGSGRYEFVQEDQSGGTGEKEPVLWYLDSADSTRPRPAGEYIDRLTQCDFTLCVAGYTNWTNRPVEALSRGSVPVIDEMESRVYDLDLVDGKNCILVKDKDWLGAAERALAVSREDLVRMRTDVAGMRESHLLPEVAAARLRKKMGL